MSFEPDSSLVATVNDWIARNWKIFVPDDHDGIELEPPRRRQRTPAVDYTQTTWYRWMMDPSIEDENSRLGKLFRLRFRMPYLMFRDYLIPLVRRANIFSSAANVRIPLEIKVLCALRILGRGSYCDDISEMSQVPLSTVNSIFKDFVIGFTSAYFSEFVRFPEGQRRRDVMEMYSLLGFPGCIGSMDATHVRLGKCPFSLINVCKGKEGYPSLAWMVIVDHARMALYVSDAYLGATNDKTMCNVDPFLRDIQRGLFSEVEFFVVDDNGLRQRCKGAWLLCDGGMLKKACFIDPMHERTSFDEVLWSEWAESTRKDVECFFGGAKFRWRILLNRVEYHSLQLINAIFKCCCILQNLLLIWDGKDVTSMMSAEYWERHDPDGVIPTAEGPLRRFVRLQTLRSQNLRYQDTREIMSTIERNQEGTLQFVPGIDYRNLREALVRSFVMQHRAGLICKPSSHKWDLA